MASVTFKLVQKISSLRSKKFCRENEVSTQLNKSESTLMEIQKILVWHDPLFSCSCIISVNIVFWLIIYLDFKFYGILFTTFFILTCEQLWLEHFSKYLNRNNSSSQKHVLDCSKTSEFSSTEINTFFKKGLIMIKETYVKARFIRQSQPGMFCILTCLIFLLLGIIGRSLSGVLAFYILIMLVMTVPGVFIRFLQPYVIKSLSDLFYSSRKATCSDSDDDVEPYLPETSEETLELFRLAGDLQPPNTEDDEESNDVLLERINEHASDTTESVCSKSSLYPESVIMPSPENSMDFWDFDLQLEQKAELDETESNGINFQSKHFNGDSSEEEFVKGLDLLKETSTKFKKNENPQSKSILTAENLISMGKKFFGRELEKKNHAKSDKESSSDTDSFEFISEEDM